jgi:hypothetical protein
MPPARIGLARRLDCVGEIQALASRWQNCLRDYICSVNSGWRAIYLWGDQVTPAVCSVSRHGRLGWFLDDVKGSKMSAYPDNVRIEDSPDYDRDRRAEPRPQGAQRDGRLAAPPRRVREIIEPWERPMQEALVVRRETHIPAPPAAVFAFAGHWLSSG